MRDDLHKVVSNAFLCGVFAGTMILLFMQGRATRTRASGS